MRLMFSAFTPPDLYQLGTSKSNIVEVQLMRCWLATYIHIKSNGQGFQQTFLVITGLKTSNIINATFNLLVLVELRSRTGVTGARDWTTSARHPC